MQVKTDIKRLMLEITSHCNLHCPQCPRFQEDGHLQKFLTPDHLDFNVLKNSIGDHVLSNLDEVIFEGDYGDCVMHPQIDQYIEFFKNVPLVTIFTNGSIRNSKWYEKIAQYSNVEIVFSIDGLEDTNHIYRINSNWKKIVENVSSFTKSGGTAHWKFLVFKHNQHQIDKAKELSQKLGFASFDAVHTNRNFFNKESWPVMIDGEYQYDLLISDSKNVNREKTSIIASSEAEKFNCPGCNKYWINTLYINHKGCVLPCCMTSGVTWSNGMSDRLFKKIIGNLDDIDLHINTVDDILKSDFYTFKLYESWKSIKTAHHICVWHCTKH